MPRKTEKDNGSKKKTDRLISRVIKRLPTKEQLRQLPKMLSRKERHLILILSIITLGSLIAIPISAYYHFTKSAPAFGGSFTEGVVGTPKYINPLLANDTDSDLAELVYSGLMKYDSEGKLDYDLAKSYNISDDGLTYTFTLRDNLKWHDGQPLTADDVIFTILTAQNADFGSPQIVNWLGVDVSKTDDKTVVFKLKNKYAQFLNNTILGILPKHIWENFKASAFGLSDFNIKPIGSGPYKFSKVRRDSSGNIISLELASFDKYYAGRPYISKITFRIYDSEDSLIAGYNANEIDELGSVSSQNIKSIRLASQLNIDKLKLPRYFAIFFNQSKSKPLSDKNVRMALAYATDKNEILKNVLDGNGTIVDSPMLPGILNIPDSAPKYGFDLNNAKKILDDSGWKYSETDKVREKAAPAVKNKKTTAEPEKLSIGLITPNSPELVSVANLIKTQWEALGAQVNLNILSPSELTQARKNRDYDALLFGEILNLDPEPFSFWHSSQRKDPGLNLALYDNKDADKLLEDARQSLDVSTRLAKYNDFQKIVATNIPAIFLYSPYYIYPQSAKIRGNDSSLIFVPSNRFDTVNKWYIETRRVFR